MVVAREDEAGHRRLVAYLTGPGGARRPRGLRAFVGERLPAYMVPAAWVALDALPLTPNNKVDRAALPDADGAGLGRRSGAPPRDELERRVADLFGEVLRVEGVGRDDGFFELGGDSLLVTEVLARLGEEPGVRLPLDILVDAPTPATLAGAIERARARASEHAFPPLVPQAADVGGAVSVSQEQICFLNDLDPTSVGLPVPGDHLAARGPRRRARSSGRSARSSRATRSTGPPSPAGTEAGPPRSTSRSRSSST